VRLFRANLRKLVRRPATYVTFVLLVGLLALVLVAVVAGSRQSTDPDAALAARLFVTFPDAYELVLAMVLGIGGLLAVTYGAAIAGSEWTWGTLKAAVARGESRTRYTVLGYAAVAAFACLGLLAAFLIGVLAAAGGAIVTGVSLDGVGDAAALGRLPEQLLRAGLALSMNAALGFAIATIARSQLAGIGVGIGLFFAEGLASLFLPEVIKWFPFAASAAVTSGSASGSVAVQGETVTGSSLDPNLAVVVVSCWLVASLVASALWTERAEIGG